MSATKQYRQWHPHQPFLFPPSPHDWLDEGDLAYCILDVVDALDLSAIEAAIHAKDARGNRPWFLFHLHAASAPPAAQASQPHAVTTRLQSGP